MKIYIGGSRKLKQSAALKQVVKSILAGGNQITVGCATGADQQVIEACQSSISQCHVHAAFSENGNGSHSGSAVATVQAFCRAGGRVSWLAGGSLAVPLVARLMSRSLAGLRSANRAIFFEPGAGSLKVARAALKMSLPVTIICSAMSTPPILPAAATKITRSGITCWHYQPATQANLF